MTPSLALAGLAAALAASAAAFRVRDQPESETSASCEADDLAMARLTSAVCAINWALKDPEHWSDTSTVGCWELQAYNTDKFFSSAVYKRKTDNRCALTFSGYHGRLAGYIRGALALVWPLTTWEVCGYNMYAPYIRLFHHHTSLSNWSTLMHTLAGPNSSCQGEPIFSAESMGGSTGEMIAACASAGRLHEIMPQNLPQFHLQELYTFGSPAVSTVPLTNKLRPDGCFLGKRVFFAADLISHAGTLSNLMHPRMDAVEIWPSEWDFVLQRYAKPSVEVFPCKTQEAIGDPLKVKPHEPKVGKEFTGERDVLQHSSTSYEADIRWFHDAGMGDLFKTDISKQAHVNFMPKLNGEDFLEKLNDEDFSEKLNTEDFENRQDHTTSARYVAAYEQLAKLRA